MSPHCLITMFPTSGFFRDLICPFFASSICERPYCHFRHAKPEAKRTQHSHCQRVPGDLPSYHTSGSRQSQNASPSKRRHEKSYLNHYSNAAKRVQRGVEKDKAYRIRRKESVATSAKSKVWYNPDRVTLDDGSMCIADDDEVKVQTNSKPNSVPHADSRQCAPCTYIPTPIKNQSPEPKQYNVASSSKPTYKPTKIGSIVKPETVVSSSSPSVQYNPTPINQLKNKKYTTAPTKIGPENDLEYDPANNFSTETSVQEDKKRSWGESVMSTEAVFSEDEDTVPEKIWKADNDDESQIHGKTTNYSENQYNDVNEDNYSSSESCYKKSVGAENDTVVLKHVDTIANQLQDGAHHIESRGVGNNKEKEAKQRQTKQEVFKLNDNKSSTKDKKISSSKDRKSSSSSKDKTSSSSKVKELSSKEKSSSKDKLSKSSSSTDKVQRSSSTDKVYRSSSMDKVHRSSSTDKVHKSSSSKDKKSSSKDKKSIKDAKLSSSSKHKNSSSKDNKSSSSKDRKSSSSRHDRKLSKDNKESSSSGKHSLFGTSQDKDRSSNKHSKHSSKDGHRHSSSSHKSSSKKSSSHFSKDTKNTEKSDKLKYNAKGNFREKNKGKSGLLGNLFGDESESDSADSAHGDTESDSVVLISDYTEQTMSGSASDSESELDDIPTAVGSDDDTYDECLKIFNENKAVQKQLPTKKLKESTSQQAEDLPEAQMKQRVAHKGRTSLSRPVKKIAARPCSQLTPAQVMHNRYAEMQKRKLELLQAGTDVQSQSHLTSRQGKLGHTLLSKRQRIAETDQTIVGSHERGSQRIAHVPTKKEVLKRPSLPTMYGCKVPMAVRQTYLNKIIDECLKIYDEEEDAYQRGLTEEKAVYERSSNRVVYLNVAINAVKRLRSEIAANKKSPVSSSITIKPRLSHEAILGGAKAAKTSYSILQRTSASTTLNQLTETSLYKLLGKYILTDDQLVEHGFPRINPDKPGTAIIHRRDSQKSLKSSDPDEKLCVRCGKMFIVYPNGMYPFKEECVHHWGKAWKRKFNGAMENRYTCCEGDLSSQGCQVAKLHVFDDNRYDNHTGYVRTLPTSPPPDGNFKVYALDCEMVYTTAGMELARVTVINHQLQPVYEATVKPSHAVVDYNTRFSGLTESDMIGVTDRLRDIQAVLLAMFSDKTILIGHSLESDFLSLKLIHSTVVDTSVVFPHRLGLPYKRALKTLMSDYLQKIIQDNEGGHDSHEDAMACMELMIWKIKQDVKKQQRKS